MKSILITGACGFIGYHCAKFYHEQGYDVTICDNNIRGQLDSFIHSLILDGVSYHNIDLTNASELNILKDSYDIVLHLAAINGTDNFYKIPFDVMRVNLLSTMNLLSKFGRNCKKFIFSSSSEVYSEYIKLYPHLIPTKENVPCIIVDSNNPRFSYGSSKLCCEILLHNFNNQYGLNYNIVRFHNIYGPRMGNKHVIPQFIARAKSGCEIFDIYGDDQYRSFCYVDDAVNAIDGLVNANLNGIYNIGNDTENILIKDLAIKINSIYENYPKYSCHPAPDGSISQRIPDINKLKKDTGYLPKVSLEQGLHKTIEWYNLIHTDYFQTNGLL